MGGKGRGRRVWAMNAPHSSFINRGMGANRARQDLVVVDKLDQEVGEQ